MLVACRLADPFALEAPYGGAKAHTQAAGTGFVRSVILRTEMRAALCHAGATLDQPSISRLSAERLEPTRIAGLGAFRPFPETRRRGCGRAAGAPRRAGRNPRRRLGRLAKAVMTISRQLDERPRAVLAVTPSGPGAETAALASPWRPMARDRAAWPHTARPARSRPWRRPFWAPQAPPGGSVRRQRSPLSFHPASARPAPH